jgi:hypothetical protein
MRISWSVQVLKALRFLLVAAVNWGDIADRNVMVK